MVQKDSPFRFRRTSLLVVLHPFFLLYDGFSRSEISVCLREVGKTKRSYTTNSVLGGSHGGFLVEKEGVLERELGLFSIRNVGKTSFQELG